MRRAIAPFILLLILLAGCETEKDPVEKPLDPSLLLSDGYCLMSGDQVLVNHELIEYYDYGTHLVYLKNLGSITEILEETASLTVYAGKEKIYDISTQPGYSSYAPVGPLIWTHPTFYEAYVIAIDQIYTYDVMRGSIADCREDPRIVEALKKYGQYREGLSVKIISLEFSDGNKVELKLELTNEDAETYYYLDPGKMGMGLFHYFTNGLSLLNTDTKIFYYNQVEHLQPEPWDSWDLDWLSVIEGGDSVILSFSYDNFEEHPAGSYSANFRFPGLAHVERAELDQKDGRIWLGKVGVSKEVVVE